MAIIIVKKGAVGLPKPDRVVEEQEAKDAAAAAAKPEDPKAWWAMRMPGIGQKPVACAHCHKVYLMPCNDTTHKSCGNWFELEKRRIAREAKEVVKQQ